MSSRHTTSVPWNKYLRQLLYLIFYSKMYLILDFTTFIEENIKQRKYFCWYHCRSIFKTGDIRLYFCFGLQTICYIGTDYWVLHLWKVSKTEIYEWNFEEKWCYIHILIHMWSLLLISLCQIIIYNIMDELLNILNNKFGGVLSGIRHGCTNSYIIIKCWLIVAINSQLIDDNKGNGGNIHLPKCNTLDMYYLCVVNT